MSGPHPSGEQIMAWLDGESATAAADIERHVGECAECRRVVEDVRGVSDRLHAWTVEPAAIEWRALPRRRMRWRWIAMGTLLFSGLLLWSLHTGHTIGEPAPSSNPVVTITVFVDWQCPACVHLEYAPVVAAYDASNPGAVRYEVKDYPLNSSCNPAVSTHLHAAACEAAAMVRMARERGHADEVIDWIVRNQPTLTVYVIKAEARDALGVSDFDAEYAKVRQAIDRDVADGISRHLQFTPSVFVDGVLWQQSSGAPPSPQELDAAIRRALTAARH